MSWMDTKNCPMCGADDFDPDCDDVDIGVGVQEFNLRGMCRACGFISQCGRCGKWLGEEDLEHLERDCEAHIEKLRQLAERARASAGKLVEE